MNENASRLKEMIDRALVDGKLSKKENYQIKAAMYSGNKVSTEESKLYRELQEKIWLGEVQIDTW
ncbi:MAG TPA: hypothetical protein V6C58_18400 [Allocoleopsis sp.]